MAKFYLVGGYVRDFLLNPNADRDDFAADKDYLVVESSPEELTQLGFRAVGQHFPVFIHPKTGEEYALARKEIKTGKGYKGFDFVFDSTVTMEEDLKRRDFTINAMAMDEESGEIFDFFGGQQDLQEKLLRHVSSHFDEDPLRVIRGARFLAKLKGFRLAHETLDLIKDICRGDELEHLSGERVLLEFQKAFQKGSAKIFLDHLYEFGALKKILPELSQLKGVPQNKKYHPEGCAFIHTLLVVENACQLTSDFDIQFSCLVHDLGKGITPKEVLPKHTGHEKAGMPLVEKVCERFKVSAKTKQLALKVTEFHLQCHRVLEMRAEKVLGLMEKLDAFRRPELLKDFLLCCRCDDLGKLSKNYPQESFLLECLESCQKLKFEEEKKKFSGRDLGEAIRKRKVEEIKRVREKKGWV